MKIKTNYQAAEFKERQESFEFYCAQAFEFLLKFRKECRAGWAEIFKSVNLQPFVHKQEEFSFNPIRSLKEWATWTTSKNHELAI